MAGKRGEYVLGPTPILRDERGGRMGVWPNEELAELIRERDELRAEVERLNRVVSELQARRN